MKLLVFLLFIERIVFIFGQLLEISNATIEQGDMFTVSCSVTTINKAITFKVENTAVGSCSPPFGTIVTCDKPDIKQNVSSGITSWTISSAQVSYNGDWTCSLGADHSPQVQLIIYKLPTTVLASSGIISNAVVNNTVSYTVNVEVGCLFSDNGPRINLQFMEATIPKTTISMTCTNSSTVCSTCTGCSAYDCNHNITLDDLKSGDIKEKVAYTLQIEVGVLGTTVSYTHALFPGFTVTFESPTSQTNTVLLTERITTTTNYINEYSNTNVPLPRETVTPSNFISETVTPSNFISETVTPSNFKSETVIPSNFISKTVIPSNLISDTTTPSNFISEITTPTSLGKLSTLVFDAEISKTTLISLSSSKILEFVNSPEMTEITLSHFTSILFTSSDLPTVITWFSANSDTTSFPMLNLFLSSFDSFSSQTRSFFSQTILKTSFLETSDITSNTLFSITGVLSDSSSTITKLPIVLLTSISTPNFKFYSTPLSTFTVAISTNSLLGSTHKNTDDIVDTISVLSYHTTYSDMLTSYTSNTGIVLKTEITNIKSYYIRSETYLTNDQNAMSDSVRKATNSYVSSEFHSQTLGTTQPLISIDTLVHATSSGNEDTTSCSGVLKTYTPASTALMHPFPSEISKLSTISLPGMTLKATLLESSIYSSSIEDNIIATEVQNSGFLSSISINLSKSIETAIKMKTNSSLVTASIFAFNPTTQESRMFMSGYLQSSVYPTEHDFLSTPTEYFVTTIQATKSFLVSSTEKYPSIVRSNIRTTGITVSETQSNVYTEQNAEILTIKDSSFIKSIVPLSIIWTTEVASKSEWDLSTSDHLFSRTTAVNSLIPAQYTLQSSYFSLLDNNDGPNVLVSASVPDSSSVAFIPKTVDSTIYTKAGLRETTKDVLFITTTSGVAVLIITVSSIMLLRMVVLIKRKRTLEMKAVDDSLSNDAQSVRKVFPEFPYTERSIYPRFSNTLSTFTKSPYEHNWNDV